MSIRTKFFALAGVILAMFGIVVGVLSQSPEETGRRPRINSGSLDSDAADAHSSWRRTPGTTKRAMRGCPKIVQTWSNENRHWNFPEL